MTPEQEKTVDRCKAMLKRAFPVMSGKIIFRLFLHKPGIEVDMFMPNIKVRTEPDREVTEVRL